MATSLSEETSSSIIVAFRARPPRGRFFQPQGSVSPWTLAVVAILIVVASVATINPIWKNKIIDNHFFILQFYPD